MRKLEAVQNRGAGSTFGADVLKYNVAQKYTTDARSAAPEKAAYIYAGQIRDELGSRLDLLEKNAYRFCYINDFPMSGTAQDLMYGAPSEITEQQLREVHKKYVIKRFFENFLYETKIV